MRGEIDNSTITVGDSNTPFSIMNRAIPNACRIL